MLFSGMRGGSVVPLDCDLGEDVTFVFVVSNVFLSLRLMLFVITLIPRWLGLVSSQVMSGVDSGVSCHYVLSRRVRVRFPSEGETS